MNKWEKEDDSETRFFKRVSLYASVVDAWIECKCQDFRDLWGINLTCRNWRNNLKETERSESCSESDKDDIWLFRRDGCANLPEKLPVLCGK